MGLQEKYGEQLNKLADLYPDDICSVFYTEPGYDVSPTQNPEYRFGFKDYRNAERHSIGESAVLLDDWSELDQFLAHFPNPSEPGNFDVVQELSLIHIFSGVYFFICGGGEPVSAQNFGIGIIIAKKTVGEHCFPDGPFYMAPALDALRAFDDHFFTGSGFVGDAACTAVPAVGGLYPCLLYTSRCV